MAERAVCHICYAQLLRRIDQAVRLVQRLERGVLCLDRIDLRDGVRFAESLRRAFGEPDVLRLPSLANLSQCGN